MARDPVEVSRLLAGATKAIASVNACWLATATGAGGVNVRPMGRVLNEPGEDDWMVRFITDGRSRKAYELRRSAKIALIFQNAVEDAFVSLIGVAMLRENASEDRRCWKDAYNVYIPSAHDLTNAAFIEVEVERMELWIRGVTPEPFGLRPSVLERQVGGAWRIIA